VSPTSDASRLARLEERTEGVRREIDRISRQVDAFGPVAGQVIEVLAEVRGLMDDIDDIKGNLRSDRSMSLTLKVALIAGSFTLLAAIATAIAQIISS
jgi:hypothetical protein